MIDMNARLFSRHVPQEPSRFDGRSALLSLLRALLLPGACAAVFGCAGAHAANSCIDYSPFAHWVAGAGTPSAAGDVAVAGGFSFITDPGQPVTGPALIVMDTRDLAAPRTVARVPLPQWPDEVELSGALAVVTCGDSGVVVVDVSDPASPRRLGHVFTPGHAAGLAVSGSSAFVACGEAGLIVVDFSDPSAPRIASTTEATGPTSDVALTGRYACVASDSFGLVVVDVVDPAHPAEIGSVAAPRNAVDLAVADERAYLCSEETLVIIDLANPRQPVVADTVGFAGWLYSVAVADSLLLVGGFPDGPAYAGGLDILRLRGSDDPVLVGRLSPFAPPFALTVVGSRLYTACSIGGLQIFELENGRSPDPLGAAVLEWDPVDVATQGHRGFVAGTEGREGRGGSLSVIDLTDPSVPDVLGRATGLGRLECVDVRGGFAVAAGDSLVVIDVTRPELPRAIARVDLPGRRAFDVCLAGDLALVASGSTGLSVFDIATPEAPQPLATVGQLGDVYAVAVRDTTAYVAAGSAGLKILSIADPASPVVLGGLMTAHWATDIALSGDLVLLAHEATGFRVVDVSSPRAPHTIGGIRSPGRVAGIKCAGSAAYVACGSQGLQVVDLSDPTRLRSIGSLSVSHDAGSVAVSASCVCAVGTSEVLHCLPLQCGAEVRALVSEFDAVAEGGRVRLRWRIAGDAPYVGFIVQRAASEFPGEEDFIGLNVTSPVPAAGPLAYEDPILPGRVHSYRLQALLPGDDWEVSEPIRVTAADAPASTRLTLVPNPSPGPTMIRFDMPGSGSFDVSIFDSGGRLVRRVAYGSTFWGSHEVPWDGRDERGHRAGSGVYLVRVEGGGDTAGARLILIRR